MANIKSAIKRNKQAIVRNDRNNSRKTAMRKAIKSFQSSILDNKATEKQLGSALSNIDHAIKHNILHKNTASRKKSQLQKAFNSQKTKK